MNDSSINSIASDNISCACLEVMDAVVAANSGIAFSYGQNDHTVESNLSLLFLKNNHGY